MSVLIENTKLFVGLPSSMLLSFYMDGEVSRWQRAKIETFIQTPSSPLHAEFQDYQKLDLVYKQLNEPVIAPDFSVRFNRKLAGLKEEMRVTSKAGILSPVPALAWMRQAMAPLLATLLVSVTLFMAVPQFLGSPLSLAEVRGTVEILEPKTDVWKAALPNTKLREGTQLRTSQGAQADLVLPGQLKIRAKENSLLKLEQLIRSHQKGKILIKQETGKTLVGLSPQFKGSQLSLETPFGTANAFGTIFLVDVMPAMAATRVMVLEGTVEVEDIKKLSIQPVTPQTERVIRSEQIGISEPIAAAKKLEVEELMSFAIPGSEPQPQNLAEENLNLMLISGPSRVQEYLENPRIYTNLEYPILTDKIFEVRKLIAQAGQTGDTGTYQAVIQDLNTFMETYLDPFGHFEPHLQFFIGAIYHSLNQPENALEALSKILASQDPSWQAMAHLARGIIYQESLNTGSARIEYEAVLQAAPNSPEAATAEDLLSKLKK